MTDERNRPPKSEAHNRHHAQKRRARRDAHRATGAQRHRTVEREDTARLLLYGLHTVRAALTNPARKKFVLHASKNALAKLEEAVLDDTQVEECHPRELDRLVGSEAVHQGVVLHCAPLAAKSLPELGECDLVLVLDQVTDPHNVGAIMRSAVAMNAGAVVTTSRYSPVESGVLAKSASGALDLIDHVEVRNLAEALEVLHESGYTSIGLDSEGDSVLDTLPGQNKIALVMGSEGKGLRQKTRQTCHHLVRLDIPGKIKSLNVSNAAVLALYLARRLLVPSHQR